MKRLSDRLQIGRRGSERGASFIEFTLILPYYMLLLFGVIEFAQLGAISVSLGNGLRSTARLVGGIQPADPSECGQLAADKLREELRLFNLSSALIGFEGILEPDPLPDYDRDLNGDVPPNQDNDFMRLRVTVAVSCGLCRFFDGQFQLETLVLLENSGSCEEWDTLAPPSED